MKLDSHQHFWRYDPAQYPWMTEKLGRIRRDFLPEDLAPELAKAGIGGTVAVQARQTVEESAWLLGLADRSPIVKGVVGWVDLRSEEADAQLDRFAAHPKFVGVRHVVQDEPDDRFMLQPRFLEGLALLEKYGLAYDLLLFPKHLPVAVEVVKLFPNQRFVLDHLAKPFIKAGTIQPWEEDLRRLAAFPNVLCKISGMVTEAAWGEWKQGDFTPYLDAAFAAFGEDRLMFGSDWPVSLLSADYGQTFGIVEQYLAGFSAAAREKVLGANCARFYGIGG